MECTCPHLVLGTKVLEQRNWNPKCEEHGLDSEWYNSTGQREQRIQTTRTRKLQWLARQRRKGNISKEEAQNIMQTIDEEILLERQEEGQQEEQV